MSRRHLSAPTANASAKGAGQCLGLSARRPIYCCTGMEKSRVLTAEFETLAEMRASSADWFYNGEEPECWGRDNEAGLSLDEIPVWSDAEQEDH